MHRLRVWELSVCVVRETDCGVEAMEGGEGCRSSVQVTHAVDGKSQTENFEASRVRAWTETEISTACTRVHVMSELLGPYNDATYTIDIDLHIDAHHNHNTDQHP